MDSERMNVVPAELGLFPTKGSTALLHGTHFGITLNGQREYIIKLTSRPKIVKWRRELVILLENAGTEWFSTCLQEHLGCQFGQGGGFGLVAVGRT